MCVGEGGKECVWGKCVCGGGRRRKGVCVCGESVWVCVGRRKGVCVCKEERSVCIQGEGEESIDVVSNHYFTMMSLYLTMTLCKLLIPSSCRTQQEEGV